MPDEPEALGLLALLLLTESRRAARTARRRHRSCCLPDQDRALWDRDAHRRGPGASCGAACAATSPARTRSRPRSTRCTATPRPRPTPTGARSSQLYDQLLAIAPERRSSRSTARSRVAEVDGPAPALAIVDALDLDALPPVPRHPRRAARSARPRRRRRARAYDRALALAAQRRRARAPRTEAPRTDVVTRYDEPIGIPRRQIATEHLLELGDDRRRSTRTACGAARSSAARSGRGRCPVAAGS